MALLLAVPLLGNGYADTVVRNILMYAALAYGWNMIGGYTGYVSFGNVTFFGMGAYCAAICSRRTGSIILYRDFVAVSAGGVCALFAAIVGHSGAAAFADPISALRRSGIGLALSDIVSNLDMLGRHRRP